MIDNKSSALNILAGWFFDGTGCPAQKDVSIKIKNNIIKAINNIQSGDLISGDIIDLRHCTIMPGLVDSHVHLAMSGSVDPAVRDMQLRIPFEDIEKTMGMRILRNLSCGVLALRDGGDRACHTLNLKHRYLNPDKYPVCVKTPGWGWHAKGRYGRFIGESPQGGKPLKDSVVSFRKNIDHIKIINSGLNSFKKFGKETSPQFAFNELKEAIKKGDSLGLKTMIHANGKEPVHMAIEAGCHSIEHGYFMGNDNLRLMAEKGVFWVPTLIPVNAVAQLSDKGSKEADIAYRTLEHQFEQITIAKKIGVKIAVGTDAGSIGVYHGKAVAEEMKLLLKAGLPIEDVVCAATCNGAELLGINKITGALKKGMPATFIAFSGDLLSVLDKLSPPEQIYVNGGKLDVMKMSTPPLDKII